MAELTPVQIERGLGRSNAASTAASRSVALPSVSAPGGAVADFALGGAVREFGADLTDISARLQQAKRVQDVAGASATIQGELGALADEARQATIHDPLERGPRFRERFDARTAEIIDGLPLGTQALVRDRVGVMGRQTERTLRTEGRAAFAESMRATFDQLVDQSHVAYTQAQSPQEADALFENLREVTAQFVEQGALTQAEATKTLGAFRQEADTSRILLRIQTHPELMEEHLTQIAQGEPGIGALPTIKDPGQLGKLLALATTAARQQRRDQATQEDSDEKVFQEMQADAATEYRARLFVIPPTSEHADQLRAMQKELNRAGLTDVIDEGDHATLGRMAQTMLAVATNPDTVTSDEATFESLTIDLHATETLDDIFAFENAVLASADKLTGQDIGRFLAAAERRTNANHYSNLAEARAARRMIVDEAVPAGAIGKVRLEKAELQNLSAALRELDDRLAAHGQEGPAAVRKFARDEALAIIAAYFPSTRKAVALSGGLPPLPPELVPITTEREAADVLERLQRPPGLSELSWRKNKALFWRRWRWEQEKELKRQGAIGVR